MLIQNGSCTKNIKFTLNILGSTKAIYSIFLCNNEGLFITLYNPFPLSFVVSMGVI
jgi:hypothetical protein